LDEALEIRRRIRDFQGCARTLTELAELDLDRIAQSGAGESAGTKPNAEGHIRSAASRIREAIALVGDDVHFRLRGELLRVLARIALAADSPELAIELLSCGQRNADNHLDHQAAKFRSDCSRPLSLARAALSASDADAAWDLGQSRTDPVARIRSALAEIGIPS
jgi:hypothetical protein